MGLGRDELLDMHDRCAATRQRILNAAAQGLPQAQVIRIADQLGLPENSEWAQVPEDDLAFVLDLAVHDARPGRARAIDHAARQQMRHAQREKALVARALETSWFSVFRVLGLHPEAGLIVEDAMLGGEAWVLDGLLERLSEPNTLLAARLGRVQGFAMTSGVVATLGTTMLNGLRQAVSASGLAAAEMMAEPRVAMLAYRQAIGLGVRDLLGRG